MLRKVALHDRRVARGGAWIRNERAIISPILWIMSAAEARVRPRAPDNAVGQSRPSPVAEPGTAVAFAGSAASPGLELELESEHAAPLRVGWEPAQRV